MKDAARSRLACNSILVAGLIAAYAAVALAPLALAALAGLPRRPLLDEISSGLAMASLAVLLLEFALLARFRALAGTLGLDTVQRVHQLLAYAAVCFVLLHPWLYSLPYAERPWDHTRAQHVWLTPAGTVSGMLAWVLLLFMVALASFRDQLPWRYELWRASHAACAALVVLAGTHHALEVGRYSAAPALARFWIVATALALAALAFVYLVRPWMRPAYRLARVRSVALATWELALEPARGAGLRFRAGQSVWLSVGRRGNPLADHPFSIASGPGDLPALRFLIKEAGDFSGSVGRLAAGERVYVDGPYGDFTLAGRRGSGIALIAGGIGVAPILSLLHGLAEARDPRPVVLVYCNRVQEQIVGRDEELEALRGRLDLRVEYVLAEPPGGWTGRAGMPDRALLESVLPPADRGRWLYFVCGPTAMIDTVEIALRDLGVPLQQICAERFRWDTGRMTPRELALFTTTGALVAAMLVALAAFVLRGRF